jgi:nanoRNase/pAp phosphatase (c-di-AMP/oligoRNAs hydrolase)
MLKLVRPVTKKPHSKTSIKLALIAACRKLFVRFSPAHLARRWSTKTLVVGPSQPVDGDSVASTKALVTMLRKSGREAYTLPTLAMYKQIDWIFSRKDFHSAMQDLMTVDFVTADLQIAYDRLLQDWKPDEIVLVDGPRSRLGFDPRGVKVFTIDHHVDGCSRDDSDAYIQHAPSAGCLLIEHYGVYDPILAVSILTDTYWLRQNNPARGAHYLDMLVDHGMTDEQLAEIQRKLMIKKDPSIIAAIHDSLLRTSGEAIFAVLNTDDKELHREVMSEFNFFARHICVVRADGYVSFKTNDRSLDLRVLAQSFGGGGHANVAACQLPEFEASTEQSVRDQVIEKLYAAFIEAVNSKARAA